MSGGGVRGDTSAAKQQPQSGFADCAVSGENQPARSVTVIRGLLLPKLADTGTKSVLIYALVLSDWQELDEMGLVSTAKLLYSLP
jgi:hypothetical protein